MTKISKHVYRNPEHRKLKEDRAFKLRIQSGKRVPHIEEVTVQKATILMEEEIENED